MKLRLESELLRRGEPLAPFVTAGDGGFETTLAMLRELGRAGVACVELGFPFSDPIADGPVLQAASQRALDAGATFGGVLDVAERCRRESDLPLVAMGYANTFLQGGWALTARRLASAGFDGWLVADLPFDEAGEMREAALEARLAPISFAAPTSSDERLAGAAAASRGFLYTISRTGVTGAATELDDPARAFLGRVRRAAGALPVALGFGIRSREHVRAALEHADLAIVGSALVERLHRELESSGDPQHAARAAAAWLDGLRSGATR